MGTQKGTQELDGKELCIPGCHNCPVSVYVKEVKSVLPFCEVCPTFNTQKHFRIEKEEQIEQVKMMVKHISITGFHPESLEITAHLKFSFRTRKLQSLHAGKSSVINTVTPARICKKPTNEHENFPD